MTKFGGKNIFVTITNIKSNFNSEIGDAVIQSIFRDHRTESPWFVWESSSKSNDHVHICYMNSKTVQFTRSTFSDLLKTFGTLSLNIQTWSRRSTYAHAKSEKKHKGKPNLWLFEKLMYCNLPAHEDYFTTDKLLSKKPTVKRVVANLETNFYRTIKIEYDKWLAQKESDLKSKPAEKLFGLIYGGASMDDLHTIYEDTNSDWKLRKYILENYDKLENMVITHEKIVSIKERQARYVEERKKFRPFQSRLSEELDGQNDRHIHLHIDGGNTGKNKFCDIESLREDTCIVQSACTKDIAFAWNEKKHRRIIIDVPRGKMEYLNTSAIEKLKNGQIFSTKYKPRFKHSDFKPSIVILGNESLSQETWTVDRVTRSWTHKDINFEWRTGAYETECLLRQSHDPASELNDEESSGF